VLPAQEGGDLPKAPTVEDIHAAAIAGHGPVKKGGGSGYLHENPTGLSGHVVPPESGLDLLPTPLPASDSRHRDVSAQVHGLKKRNSQEMVQHAQTEAARKAAQAAKDLELHKEIETFKRP
jgi:hypothetical protein